MSVHRSLKSKNALVRRRNVLTRTERVQELRDAEKWVEGQSVFGLLSPGSTLKPGATGRPASKPAPEAPAEAAPEAAPEPAEGE